MQSVKDTHSSTAAQRIVESAERLVALRETWGTHAETEKIDDDDDDEARSDTFAESYIKTVALGEHLDPLPDDDKLLSNEINCVVAQLPVHIARAACRCFFAEGALCGRPSEQAIKAALHCHNVPLDMRRGWSRQIALERELTPHVYDVILQRLTFVVDPRLLLCKRSPLQSQLGNAISTLKLRELGAIACKKCAHVVKDNEEDGRPGDTCAQCHLHRVCMSTLFCMMLIACDRSATTRPSTDWRIRFETELPAIMDRCIAQFRDARKTRSGEFMMKVVLAETQRAYVSLMANGSQKAYATYGERAWGQMCSRTAIIVNRIRRSCYAKFNSNDTEPWSISFEMLTESEVTALNGQAEDRTTKHRRPSLEFYLKLPKISAPTGKRHFTRFNKLYDRLCATASRRRRQVASEATMRRHILDTGTKAAEQKRITAFMTGNAVFGSRRFTEEMRAYFHYYCGAQAMYCDKMFIPNICLLLHISARLQPTDTAPRLSDGALDLIARVFRPFEDKSVWDLIDTIDADDLYILLYTTAIIFQLRRVRLISVNNADHRLDGDALLFRQRLANQYVHSEVPGVGDRDIAMCLSHGLIRHPDMTMTMVPIIRLGGSAASMAGAYRANNVDINTGRHDIAQVHKTSSNSTTTTTTTTTTSSSTIASNSVNALDADANVDDILDAIMQAAWCAKGDKGIDCEANSDTNTNDNHLVIAHRQSKPKHKGGRGSRRTMTSVLGTNVDGDWEQYCHSTRPGRRWWSYLVAQGIAVGGDDQDEATRDWDRVQQSSRTGVKTTPDLACPTFPGYRGQKLVLIDGARKAVALNGNQPRICIACPDCNRIIEPRHIHRGGPTLSYLCCDLCSFYWAERIMLGANWETQMELPASYWNGHGVTRAAATARCALCDTRRMYSSVVLTVYQEEYGRQRVSVCGMHGNTWIDNICEGRPWLMQYGAPRLADLRNIAAVERKEREAVCANRKSTRRRPWGR